MDDCPSWSVPPHHDEGHAVKITGRYELQKEIAKISFLKKCLICLVLRRREWKIASAYSHAAFVAYCENKGGDDTTAELCEDLRKVSDIKWAKLYRIDFTP